MMNSKNFFSRFYVDVKSHTNNYHLVHKEGCPFLPEKGKRISLVSTCANEALIEAKNHFSSNVRCSFCLKEEHKSTKELLFEEVSLAGKFPVSSSIKPNREDAMHCYAN